VMKKSRPGTRKSIELENLESITESFFSFASQASNEEKVRFDSCCVGWPLTPRSRSDMVVR
jgi:hypothetical protein